MKNLSVGDFLDGPDVDKNRYEIMDIKEGGFGQVFIVKDRELNRDNTDIFLQAIKTFKDEYITDDRIIENLKQEANIWIELGFHLNIVMAYFFYGINRRPYIIMEFVDGGNLYDYISEHGISLKSGLEYAIQICNGMEYACQSIQLVHQDLKPANILVTSRGIVKITDFGISRSFDTDTSRGLTPEYASPEQFKGLEIDTRSDIYSFGVVLYEMFTGKKPFEIPNEYENALNDVKYQLFKDMHTSNNVSYPSTINQTIPNEISTIIVKCLEKKPEKRYQSFTRLKNDLLKTYEHILNKNYHFPEIDRTKYTWYWDMRGNSYSNLGRFNDAIECFDKALAIDPTYYFSLHNKSVTLLQMKKPDDALKYCELALKIKPLDAASYHQKGLIYISVKRYSEAIQSFDKALSLDPNLYYSWFEKAMIFLELNQYGEAMDCLDRGLKINPFDAKALFQKGLIYYNVNLYGEAIECFQKALELDQNNPRIWCNLGTSYIGIGKQQEALYCFNKALEINPDDEITKENKRQLLNDMN